MKTFGSYVKSLRIENQISLREFSKLVHYDPSNWSKVERDLIQPPKSKEIISKIAKLLKLKKDTEEYNLLFDLSAISFIPKELVEKEQLEKLPLFFRTVRGKSPTKKELEDLVKLLEEE
jgi:transcriptional regulator with XRE-family HTH domain